MGYRNYGEEDEAREDACWRITIRRCIQKENLKGLEELRDGPEALSPEIKELLNEAIKKLKGKELDR